MDYGMCGTNKDYGICLALIIMVCRGVPRRLLTFYFVLFWFGFLSFR